jgi:hypothetical protein
MTVSAPVCLIVSDFLFNILFDVDGKPIEKTPPKPQHNFDLSSMKFSPA